MSRLRLIAFEPQDVAVLASHLQDAVAKVGELTYRPAERRFVALLNRFAWESAGGMDAPERHRAALRIERVERARIIGVDLNAPAVVLSLLTVTFSSDPDPAQAPAGSLTLLFSGGAAIKLDVECLEMVLEDLGPAWKAKSQPQHPERPRKA